MTRPESRTEAPATGGTAPRAKREPEAARQVAIEAARLLRDDKCEEVVVLDVRGLSQVTNYIVIGTGTSERQMRAVLHHVRDMGEERGFPAFRTSADDGSRWLLADMVEIVVHLFEPVARRHYDLEMLWGDASRIEWDDRRKGEPT